LKVATNVIPNKIVTVRPSDKSWYNNYLRDLCTIKDRAFKYASRHHCEESVKYYKVRRNKYFDECRKAIAKFKELTYEKLSTFSKSKPKQWWGSVKSLLGKKRGSSIPTLVHNGKQCTTDTEKAEAFNLTYLESSNLNDDDAILPNLPSPKHELLETITISENDVNEIILGLDTTKSYGPDEVSPRMIKEARPSIVSSLTKLFNLSLLTETFPDLWKRANVSPLFKKAEDFLTINYRPVSLLSILSKVFEKIVFRHMYNYFRKHFMISV
jgi:hypothetical protein